MRPPFGYFGAKTAIAEEIAALLPAHQHYVEPYCGSLAVLLAKRPSLMETVNDIDRDIVTFWRVLRDHPADLERACALTPHSRAEYADAYEPASDEIEQARRVWVRLTQGRSGTLQRTGWRFSENPTPAGHSAKTSHVATYVRRLAPAAERLAAVTLECRPALDVIGAYGRHPGVLIYADPPYLGSTRAGSRYRHEMTSDADHRALAEALRACRAAVVLSGYDSPLYAEMLGDWHRLDVGTRTGNGSAGAMARTEVLWSNRPLGTMLTLFDEVPA
jgi:DNA adenine methylase